MKNKQKTQRKNNQRLTDLELTSLGKKKKQTLLKKDLTVQKPSMTLKNKKLSYRSKSSKTGKLSEKRTPHLLTKKLQKKELKKNKRSSLG